MDEKCDAGVGNLIIGLREGGGVFIELGGGRRVYLAAVEVGRGKVRLGVEAPQDVAVRRGENP